MIAPPKSPSHDELEALIKEARARQLRRRLLGAAGVAIAAAIGLSAYALAGGDGGHAILAGESASAGPPECRASQVSATAALNGATGTMDGLATLTNTGGTACSLPGTAPRVGIFWHGKQMPARQKRFGESGGVPLHILAPGTRAVIHLDWSEWCGAPSAGTLFSPTFRLRFVGLEVAARAQLMTPPRCDLPGAGTNRSTILVSRPVTR